MFVFYNGNNTESHSDLRAKQYIFISPQPKYKMRLSADSQGNTFQADRKCVFHYKVTVSLFFSTFLSKQEKENGEDVNSSQERNMLHNRFPSEDSCLS